MSEPRRRAIAVAALRATALGSLLALQAVGGGPVAAAYRVQAEHAAAFLKLGPATFPFDAEAQALDEIAATGTLRTPRVLACGTSEDAGYLLLEWIELADRGDWALAGRRLAALHACVKPQHGWHRDNAIGASPQLNTPSERWADFYREQRLRPQFACAQAGGLQRLAALEAQTCAASDALLAAHVPAASILHGDLWRGNLAFDATGQPVVFDPALYYGDAETDLGMARLFGGFPDAFYRAYAETHPVTAGAGQRLPLYQLYHVLNHANLFGGGYIAQAMALIGQLEATFRRR